MLRLDELNIGGLKIYQDTEGFCFGTDAVLLAWFCRRKKFARPVDLCTGNGIIPLLFSAGGYQTITGVEIQSRQAEIARKSVAYNGLCDRITIFHEDIKNVSGFLQRSAFDLVSVNPPYLENGSGFQAAGGRGVARTEVGFSLRDILSAARYLLKNGGRFCMVHKPERAADIFCIMRESGIEPKVFCSVISKQGKKPELVLVEGKKGACPGMAFLPPLYLYGEDGLYTPQMKEIYEGRLPGHQTRITAV